MHKTRPLGSLKDFFPRIHQPLPLDQRESRRLLDTIKTSFRTQLDKEHGWDAPGSGPVSRLKTPIVAPLSSTTPPSAAAPLLRGSARATDRHMRAILNNPLFSPLEVGSVTEAPPNVLDKHKAIFEKAVSRGLMTLPRATGFLKQVILVTRGLPTSGLGEGFHETNPGAGLLVLEWLRSSGQERDLAFLADTHFRNVLVRALVADGLENVVWAWINRLLEAAGKSYNPEEPSVPGLLIADLVVSKSRDRELDLPYSAILKAETLVKETKSRPDLLQKAWSRLAFITTMSSKTIRPKPPVHLFDPFVAMGQVIGSRQLERAHVDLHHPVNPSSSLALKVLSSKDVWKSTDALLYFLRLRSLGFDTVRHLRRTDQAQEATRIFNLLETKLGVLLHSPRALVF
ncbi:hypothetical protein C8A01DRAFT_18265 [Parachaetomium inaequale]|uniref:Uncharacterized protein n=1 Tax=Parachaetomium inaequale TaxID=2588326 RepID=A0AAN6SPJ6_9PEZI|nr:hypothetical protein C8A01DRAFT_18265 [Parachaetomium inaequale]